MYLYVELWKARSSWLDLSKEERKSWLDKLLGALQEQLQSGVEPIGLAINDEDTPLSAGYDFIAVWRMPSKEVAQQFEQFVEDAGWHDYFDQVNARGQFMSMDDFPSAHIDLENR